MNSDLVTRWTNQMAELNIEHDKILHIINVRMNHNPYESSRNWLQMSSDKLYLTAPPIVNFKRV